ncbi:MAG: nitrilase family protein [Candidatus Sumerlaeia bacterium]|nr:nitrilase family protein [Candidatus Sumerlaeia bacterium]
MKIVRAAAVQFCHHPGDKEANFSIVEQFAAMAARERVEILVFPEMCLTGYWHVRNLSKSGIEALAEAVPDGPSTRRLVKLSAHHGMTVGAGLIEQGDDGKLYNTYVVVMPDGEVRRHRKLHCFISPHMSSGNEFTVFDTPHGCRVGVLICWDNNLVENVRLTALAGADVLIAPHQTGGCNSRSPGAMGLIDPVLWQNRHQDPEAIEEEFKGPKGREWLMRWLPARAHDNGMFLVFSNGVGQDDDEVRTGNAMILDPYGRVLTETWKAADAMVVADLDGGMLAKCTGRRWMRGRRPELYEGLCQSSGKEFDPRRARFSEEEV